MNCWLFICPIVLFSSCGLGMIPEWLERQKNHTLEKLPDGLEKEISLLDQKEDPTGEVLDLLLRPILVPRYVSSQGHEDVRQHIVNTLTALGWTVDGNDTFEMKTPLGKMPFTNVVATHDPAATRHLVLACHYDSIYGRDAFVAATDSAVPCAMMLHLASLMTKRYLDPRKGRSEVTLQLMFLDGEEAFKKWTDKDSIYGARHLAEELQGTPFSAADGDIAVTELDRIDLFVLLDLLGARKPMIANYQSNSNAEFRHLASVERRLRKRGFLDAPKIFKVMKSWGAGGPPGIADDHLPFLYRGVKVLHLIPVPFPSVWHEDSDNASVIHRPTVTTLSRVLRVFVAEYLHLARSAEEGEPDAKRARVEL